MISAVEASPSAGNCSRIEAMSSSARAVSQHVARWQGADAQLTELFRPLSASESQRMKS
jgi:hypothetical protein